MTKQKSLKTSVRERMAKTGERYTAARAQVLRGTNGGESAAARSGAVADLRGRLGEEGVVEATGHSWEHWFSVLDAWDGTTRSHRDIARHLIDVHGVPGWWAQSVTGAYEQARGRRAPGQRADGSYSATASKTVAVHIETLFDAIVDDEIRARWLPEGLVSVRTSSRPKSARFNWTDGSTRVVFGFGDKGEEKSTVALEHERLSNPEERDQMKDFWRERLADLKRLLEA
jgi:hypothetical protein